MTKVSIVVPVYNEEGNVAELHKEIKDVCEENRYEYEIIFVNDGSSDRTEEICKTLRPLKYICLRRNFGQTAAMDAGIKQAQYDYIVTMDGDRQNDPADIPMMIQYLEEHDLDVVSGWRKHRKDTVMKKFTSRGANLLRHLLVHDGIHDSGCSLKIYRRELFNNLAFKRGKLHEDLYITYRLIDKCNKLVYVDCPYYFYYQGNMESICKTYGVKNFLDEAEAYNQIYNYFACQNRVTDELIHFLIIQYLLMLEKGYKIRKNHEILVQVKQLKKWIDNNVGKCSSLNLIKKMLIHISVRDIRIYTFLKKIRGR